MSHPFILVDAGSLLCSRVFFCLPSGSWSPSPTVCGPSLPAMAPKHKRDEKRDMARAQDDSWVLETKNRLDRMAAQVDWTDDKRAPSEAAWTRAGTQDAAAYRRSEFQATYLDKERTGAQTSELVYRSSNEGLTATGFNPWRHTTFVLGRPVQVPLAYLVLLACVIS